MHSHIPVLLMMNHMIHLSLSWFVSILNHCLFTYESSGAHLDIFFSYEAISSSPPHKKNRRVKVSAERRKKEGERERGENREPNIGTVFISHCGRLQRDERGQWGERRPFRTNTLCPAWHRHTHICTHTHCLTAAIWLNEKVGLFIFNKATLILGLTFYNVLFILE